MQAPFGGTTGENAAVRGKLLGLPLFLAVLLWRATLRIRLVGEENRAAIEKAGRPVLHALWHQRMVAGILRFPWSGTVTMASKSRDGDVIAGFLWWWGFVALRGSSSRGGAEALAAMTIALSGTTRWAALTPDGPRGPARRSKRGLAKLAAALDAPVMPVGTSSSRPRFLGSWDRFLLPLPFSHCAVIFAPGLSRGPGEGEEAFLARVDAAIEAATAEADRLCGIEGAPRERSTDDPAASVTITG